VRTAAETFGIPSEILALQDMADPTTPTPRPHTSTEASLQPPMSAARALTDPQGSAIFWIGLAAILGLVMVTGQFKVQAAIGGRAGRKR
jgi:hypothetical protein